MVAIRNRNTNVPHVFRYPLWETNIFYPAGSLVSYPVESRTDSDQAYFDFYVCKFDVEYSDNTPPPDDLITWKLIMSTSTVGDSEVNAALLALDSEIQILQGLIQELIDRDSDFQQYLDSEVHERIENDSDIQFIKNAIIHRDSEWDSDLRIIDSEIQSLKDFDSDLLVNIDSDLQVLRDYDSDFKVSVDSDLQVLRDYDSDYKVSVDSDLQVLRDADSDIKAMIADHYFDSEIYARRVFFTSDSDGMLEWNSDEKTLNLTLNDDVTLQIGQEQVFYGKAQGAIANGDVVMFAGAQGDHLLFTKADVSTPGFRDEWVIGVATQSMANNDFGFVTSQGKVRDLNTSGFSEGSLLYLDPFVAGALVDSEYPSPNHSILIAAVTRSHNNHGTIYVRPKFGFHVQNLHDVDTSNVQNNDVLVWNSTRQVWENKPIGDVNAGGFDYGNYGSF